MESSRKISFIIPVFNGLEMTKVCLDSLTQTVGSSEHEIIVVDDGSTDGTRNFLSSIERPDVHIVLNNENLGYARANNAGAIKASGGFLCLANNDLVFTFGWLAPLLRAFDRYPDVGIVGNVQTSVATGAIDHAGITIALDGKPHHIRNLSLARRLRAFSTVTAVTGACIMVRREDFLAVGGFDEQFVNGAEDVDLCFQIQAEGKRVMVANHSVIGHHVSASRGTSARDEENCRKLFAKWPDRLVNLGARLWPAHYLRSVLQRRAAFRPGRIAKALLQGSGLITEPTATSLAFVRHRMAVTENHWQVQLGSDTGPDKPLLFRDFQYDGLNPSKEAGATWIREKARVTVPTSIMMRDMHIRGVVLPEHPNDPHSRGRLGLRMRINGSSIRTWKSLPVGPFMCELEAEPPAEDTATVLDLELLGTAWSNTLAYIGRRTAEWPIPGALRAYLQDFRPQRINQRLQINRIGVNGEDILDYSRPNSPFVYDFANRHARLGLNLIGWFDGELGVGESVRCAARAVRAIDIPHAFVNSRLDCIASQGDTTYQALVQNDNPYPINVFHIDAPQSGDIDLKHGIGFREGRYNIAYWAWELPEFPDDWIRYFQFFDEIWTPSRFTTEAIARKSPLPVLTMPHAIDFTLPAPGARARVNLPEDRFLFLVMYDLNSHQERKNPRSAIDAFTKAFPGGKADVGLVIKVQNTEGNEGSMAELEDAVAPLTGVHLISETLSRSVVYDLIAACDCFVSLHRSEGFGLAVAEAMYLEKPVISTDWSATVEFVHKGNGCPVDYQLVTLKQTVGPYGEGQTWADPDVEHAARWMRKIVDDRLFCKECGLNASGTINKLFAPSVIGGLYAQRLRATILW